VSGPSWDGPDLLGAMRHASAALKAHVDEVNAMNVFPVPDGDTGSNMLATILAARDEAAEVPEAERTVSRVSSAIALGALMGARGNSGVILSQIFRGISEAIHDESAVDGTILADAFERGRTLAFAAVAHPVEGTILTVARAAAQSAQAAARSSSDLEIVLAAALAAATEAVKRTPEQLPILRDAGVVDAGGRGLELLLQGALAFQRGEAIPTSTETVSSLPTFGALEEEGFGYETVFVVMPPPDARLNPAAIRARLDELGESVLVAGDANAVKIHVHNERPDQVIAYGLSLGTLSRIVVENLDRQAHERRQRAERGGTLAASASASAANGPPAWAPVTGAQRVPSNGVAIIAVTQGHGLARLFGELGVGVVEGGQSANPSAGALVEAIHATGCSDVIVLPNNPNVRLAAKQAGELTPDVRVTVVPTRNAAEGVSALLAFDAGAPATANAKRMTDAGRAVQTFQVTEAVRDARIGRRKVRRGQHIALDPDDRLLAADSDRNVTLATAIAKLKPGFELLTLYYGDEIDRKGAEELAERLQPSLDSVEIELVDGGQPHYSLLVAAE
jgi:DAK2 domain fusion protein YloV